MQRFKKVHYVSDGGPKHFKTKATIFFVCVQLPRKFGLDSVTYHFWLSNHGKWVYDAMSAVLKRQLNILGRAERRAVAGAAEYAAVASTKVRNMEGDAFQFVDQSVTYNVVGFDESKLKQHHAFRCIDFARGAQEGPDRWFTIECKETSLDAWDARLSTRARPTYSIDAGLDLAVLDVAEPTDEAAVQAGRAASDARAAVLQEERRVERREDFWPDIAVGRRVAATFSIDGDEIEFRGTVLALGRGQRPDSGEADDFFDAEFEDGEASRIYRYKDEYRLLDADELAAEAAARAPAVVNRRGRVVRPPGRSNKWRVTVEY